MSSDKSSQDYESSYESYYSLSEQETECRDTLEDYLVSADKIKRNR